jgi:hypothetical protein
MRTLARRSAATVANVLEIVILAPATSKVGASQLAVKRVVDLRISTMNPSC